MEFGNLEHAHLNAEDVLRKATQLENDSWAFRTFPIQSRFVEKLHNKAEFADLLKEVCITVFCDSLINAMSDTEAINGDESRSCFAAQERLMESIKSDALCYEFDKNRDESDNEDINEDSPDHRHHWIGIYQ
ncbi:unnamed protein product, partial [Brenthis ino]